MIPQRSHILIVGASQLGKSKTAEDLTREEICKGNLPWNFLYDREAYNNLTDYCIYFDIPFVPIDLSSPHIIGFPLIYQTEEYGPAASQLANVTAEVFDQKKASDAPIYEETATLFFR